jgi:hypothetical protein
MNEGRFPSIKLLVVSRNEQDIESAFIDKLKDISLSNQHVAKEIESLIEYRFRNDPRFNRFPDQVRIEIKGALLRGCQGV